MKILSKISLFCAAVFVCACNPVVPLPNYKVSSAENFYLLNEGIWGMNNATLDFYDAEKSAYNRNIFAQINPDIVGSLGDVGNDLKIYGGKLYAVINYSNYVEIMDAKTARHIGSVEIKNCRNIAFYGGKAYVSAFGENAAMGNSVNGIVVEIDTAALQKTRTVNVGCEPEELECSNGKIYVANSGGYSYSNHDSTISVVDIQTFTETKKINVALNLRNIRKDGNDKFYALALGNYDDIDPDIYVVENDVRVKKLGIYASNFCISGDSLYILSNKTDWAAGGNIISKKIIIYNINTQSIVNENFISDGTQIELPHNIAVNLTTKEVFVTDAKQNYNSLGELFCFTSAGVFKWKTIAGYIPSKIAFSR